MTDFPAPRRLLHGCLQFAGTPDDVGGGGTLLDQAPLNDQQRLAVVFQGAALLAHLEHGGFYLGDGHAAGAWDDAEVDGSGRLRVGEIRPGRAADLPQTFLRALLLKVFRVDDTVAGRGTARRIARRLLDLWHHRLAPISPDAAVAELLDAAEFLWSPAFAVARRALVGEHQHGEDRHPWVVGPGRARRRFLQEAREAGSTRAALEALAASPEARDLWEGFDDDGDPWQLYEEGRWERAAALWRRKGRRTREETLALAKSLRAAGKASQALALIRRRKEPEVLLLKAGCQLDLEERQSAEKTLQGLELDALTELQLVAAAELRIRLAGARYQHRQLRGWIAKMLAVESPEARAAALVVAAGAAFDMGDGAAAGRYLEEARELGPSGEQAVQWHQLEGLRRWQAGDGPGAVEHLAKAITLRRRKLPRLTAAKLWSDLALARESDGDLQGAEHACRHSLRLFAGCEGKAHNTLGLYNLADLRVRQGRLQGVADILERSLADNRLAGNARGLAYDLELWARYELAQGRPTAALARCAEARQTGDPCNLEALDVLAARAHGWSGQPEEAAACLDRRDPEAVEALDQEERPAVWALAGRFDEACRWAAGTPWQELWSSLAAGLHPPSSTWPLLDGIDPYRAARLCFDLEMLEPGVVPPARLRRSLELFRKRRLGGFASALEERAGSPWRAVTDYLQRPASLDSMTRLLRDAGYPEARLVRVTEEGTVRLAGADRQAGDGETSGEGEEGKSDEPTVVRRHASTAEGRLVLEGADGPEDPVLETLFHLFRRDLDGGEGSVPVSELSPDDRPADDGTAPPGQGILGDSPALERALSKIDRLARGDLPVLILGESGTGKELAARRLHHSSTRFSGPFLPLNCAAVSETLIQSTLFGHVRGAFTGADQNRPGIFESARGGTVFLDEIGDLPAATQGHLLRVLQEGEIRRVGESMARKVDVRIVAATHRDLARMVEEKTFRQDLYFRLRVAKVELPPLRERGSDLLLLARHFAVRERGTRIAPAARKVLRSYPWPGNIRELISVVRVAATYADFEEIQPRHLAEAGLSVDESVSENDSGPPLEADGNFHSLVEDYRKELVSRALDQHGKNQSAAARQLGLTRQALSYLARKMGLL